MATRDVLRVDSNYSLDSDVADLVTIDVAGEYSEFGPRFEWLQYQNHLVPGLRVQQEELSSRLDLTEALYESVALDWRVPPPDEFESRVDRAGVYDGQPARGLRTTATLDLSDVDNGGESTRVVLNADVPVPSILDIDQVLWFVADTPYPVLIETKFRVNGTQPMEWRARLTGLERGEVPVVWGDETRAAPLQIERSPEESRFPTDGGESPFDYPLVDALQRVENDPSLVQFAAWKLANPEHYLVGATIGFYRGDPTAQDPDRTWQLVFGTPSGAGILISSEQEPSSGEVRNHEYALADGSLPPFDVPDLPSEPVTFAHAERLWERAYDADASKKSVNWARWGYGWEYAADWVLCRPACAVPIQVSGDRDSLGTMLVGEWLEGGAVGVTYGEGNQAIVDAQTGQLASVMDYQGVTEPAAPAPREPNRDEDPAPGAVEPTTLSVGGFDGLSAAATSAGLFTLFLSLYFLPLIKFAAAHIGLLIPGYAKLTRTKVLDNAVRSELLDRIRTEPGISPPELARDIEAGWSTIVYHLRVLKQHGLVTSVIIGRNKRFFSTDDIAPHDRHRIGVLRNERTRAIYNRIREDPGLLRGDLARALDVSVPTILWHLDHLKRAHLVEEKRDRGKVRYYTAAADIPTVLRPDAVAAV